MVMRVRSRENNSWAFAPAPVPAPIVARPVVSAPIGATPVGVGMGGVLTVIGLGWSLWDRYHRSFGNPDDFISEGPTLEEQVQILEQEAQRLARSPDEADQAMARVLRGFLESLALLVPGLSADHKSIFDLSTPAITGVSHIVVVASAESSSIVPAAGTAEASSGDRDNDTALKKRIEDLGSEEYAIRRGAVAALQQDGSPEAVAALEKAIDTTLCFSTCLWAAAALIELRGFPNGIAGWPHWGSVVDAYLESDDRQARGALSAGLQGLGYTDFLPPHEKRGEYADLWTLSTRGPPLG